MDHKTIKGSIKSMNDLSKEKLGQFPMLLRTPPVNIEFEDLSYFVAGNDRKEILKSINGKFRAGELTAILGPSGCGKTTLLNVLAGYIMKDVTGNIRINDQPRQMNIFHKISTYIMQEDLLQPHLTVYESVMVSARLKLGNNCNLQSKQSVVEEVLSLLGLKNCYDTRMENLSGGEKKRLSIALEMVSNPPVIFLDEPTSGLDSVSVNQCMDILRTLADQGKTVICTIHQPSVATFQQFDQVYFIADGMCVYNGCTTNIIPFLSSVQLQCPTTYSSAEYVIETVQTNQEYVSVLVAAIQNGKINARDTSENFSFTLNSFSDNVYNKSTQFVNVNFATSFWTQFCILFGRMVLQMTRNKLVLWMQLLYHILLGISCGILYFGIGNDGGMVYTSFMYSLTVLVFFAYTHMMAPILLFPFEVKILEREYLNRWYSLKAYFLASTLRSIPVLIILGLIFIAITYLMSNQPMELTRFVSFASAGILVGIASEGLGLAVGSVCNVTNGSIVGPAIGAACICLAFQGIGFGTDIQPLMKLVTSTSYLRIALVALNLAVFENRDQFDCVTEIYCYYKDPKHILRDLGMLESSYSLNLLGLIGFSLLFRFLMFLALHCRLKAEFPNNILNYAPKILQHR